MIGGYDGTARLSGVDCLDLTEEKPQWHSVAPMTYRRGLAGVCTYQGQYPLRFNPCIARTLYGFNLVVNQIKCH